MQKRNILALIPLVPLAGACDRTYQSKETFSESGSSFDCVYTDAPLSVRPLKLVRDDYSCERKSDNGKSLEKGGHSVLECAVLDTRTEAASFYINRGSNGSCVVALQDRASFAFRLDSENPPVAAVAFVNSTSVIEHSIDLKCTQDEGFSKSDEIEPGTRGCGEGLESWYQTRHYERGDFYSTQAVCFISGNHLEYRQHCVEYMSGWTESELSEFDSHCTEVGGTWSEGTRAKCQTWGSLCLNRNGSSREGVKRVWTTPDVDFWPGSQVSVLANEDVCAATEESLAEQGL